MSNPTASTKQPTIDVAKIKRAAAGRWPEILAAVGDIPREYLHFDKNEGPCPRCGGTTRYRGLDETTGALFCSHCFNKANGDGISALQWYTGKSFKEVCNMLAGHLGISNGNARASTKNVKPEVVSTYDYRDDQGELLYQVVRYDPKDFRQRRPKPLGGWDWSVSGVRRVLYRLPELLSAALTAIIFVVEGEKDVENLVKRNLGATTIAGGADNG